LTVFTPFWKFLDPCNSTQRFHGPIIVSFVKLSSMMSSDSALS